MDQYIEFTYETIKGETLEIQGKTDGSKVKFIAYNIDHFPIPKSTLTTIDVRNIEEFILDNSEEEINYESDYYNRYDD